MPTAEAEAPQDVRMTLLQTEFLAEHGGRLPAGTVVLVDAKTARRWRDKGIAVDSAETDKTLREAKLAQLAALQAEIERLETEGTPAVTSDGPVRRGRSRE